MPVKYIISLLCIERGNFSIHSFFIQAFLILRNTVNIHSSSSHHIGNIHLKLPLFCALYVSSDGANCGEFWDAYIFVCWLPYSYRFSGALIFLCTSFFAFQYRFFLNTNFDIFAQIYFLTTHNLPFIQLCLYKLSVYLWDEKKKFFPKWNV